MKRLFVLIAICFFTTPAFAKWEKNYDKALKLAKSKNKFVLLDFTGSKWCGYCIKLEKNVFKKKAFKAYAKSDLICVELDFPSNGKAKKGLKELAKKYKVTGYPTLVILDPEGNQIGRAGYEDMSAEKYVEHLKKIIEPHKKKFEEESQQK